MVSYGLDVLSVAVVILLVQAWIRDLHVLGSATTSTPQTTATTTSFQLSTSFLTSGFCNAPQMNTQWMCACLDITAGLVFSIMGLMHKKTSGIFSSTLTMPLAAYLISHGYGHYQVATTGNLRELMTELPPKDLATLAIILCIGPIDGMKTVLRGISNNNNNQNQNHGVYYYTGVILAVAALVALYKYGLGQRQNFVLLYINVSILFTSALPRILFVGVTTPDDIHHRVDQHYYFWANVLIRISVTALVFLEPFYCDAFLANMGGHLLFDVSLLADAIGALINDSAMASKQDHPNNNDNDNKTATTKVKPKIKAV